MNSKSTQNMKQSTPLTQGSVNIDLKYKKALKQINRLISINTSVKKQLITLQQQYDALRYNYGVLEDKCSGLEDKIQEMESFISSSQKGNTNTVPSIISKAALVQSLQKQKVKQKQSERQNLSTPSKNLKQANSPVLSLNIPTSKQLQNTGTISQFINANINVNGKNKLQQQLQQLEQKLMQKQKEINRINKKLEQKQKQNSKLYQQYIQTVNEHNKAKNQLQIYKCKDERNNSSVNMNIEEIQKQKQKLKDQLKKQKQLISKISIENQILKKSLSNNSNNKQANRQSNQQSIPYPNINYKALTSSGQRNFFNNNNNQMQQRPLAVPFHQFYYPNIAPNTYPNVNVNANNNNTTSKNSSIINNLFSNQSLPYLQSHNQTFSPNDHNKVQLTDPFSQYYFKKVRDLQLQILKIKKQYNEKRQKYKTQISNLKKQIQEKNSSIKQISNFSIKQQNFIQAYVLKSGINLQMEAQNKGQYNQYTDYQTLFNKQYKIKPNNIGQSQRNARKKSHQKEPQYNFNKSNSQKSIGIQKNRQNTQHHVDEYPYGPTYEYGYRSQHKNQKSANQKIFFNKVYNNGIKK